MEQWRKDARKEPRNTDNDRLVVFGGTNDSDGSYIRLSGKNESNARAEIRTIGADGSGKSLVIYPNGDFKWNGSKVLTEADKTLITQWGLPNYSAIITGLAMTYTAPHNGVVLFNKDVGGDSGNVTVNGVTVYLGGNDASNEGNVTLFLKKGDTINMSPASAVGSKCFVPLYHGG